MLNLGIRTTYLWGGTQQKHRREKIDLHKKTAVWKTYESGTTFELEAPRDAIDNRENASVTQH